MQREPAVKVWWEAQITELASELAARERHHEGSEGWRKKNQQLEFTTAMKTTYVLSMRRESNFDKVLPSCTVTMRLRVSALSVDHNGWLLK